METNELSETSELEILIVNWIHSYLKEESHTLSFRDKDFLPDLVTVLLRIFPTLSYLVDTKFDDEIVHTDIEDLFYLLLQQIGIRKCYYSICYDDDSFNGPFRLLLIILLNRILELSDESVHQIPSKLQQFVNTSISGINMESKTSILPEFYATHRPELLGVKSRDLQANFSDMDDVEEEEEESIDKSIDNKQQSENNRLLSLIFSRIFGESILDGKGDIDMDTISESSIQDTASLLEALSHISSTDDYLKDNDFSILYDEKMKNSREEFLSKSISSMEDVIDDEDFDEDIEEKEDMFDPYKSDLISIFKNVDLLQSEDSQEMSDSDSIPEPINNIDENKSNREIVDHLQEFLEFAKFQKNKKNLESSS